MDKKTYKKRYVINGRGKKLFHISRQCEEANANLIFIHDYSLYSTVYAPFFDKLYKNNINIFSFDLEGFGKSDGMRGDIREFEYYVNDARYLFDKIKEECNDNPVILAGHGLGALVAIQSYFYLRNQLDGLILMAPLFNYSALLPKIMQDMARYISAVASTFPVTSVSLCKFCNERTVLKALKEDELIYKGKLRARMAAHIIEEGERSQKWMDKIEIPTLFMQGSDDMLAVNDGLCDKLSISSSPNIDVEIIEGGEHLFMLQDVGSEAEKKLINWLEKKIIKEKIYS